MKQEKITMPGFDFFSQPVNAKLIRAITEDGGYKTIALRREIFTGDGFESGKKMIKELEQINSVAPDVDLIVHFQFWPSQEWILKNGDEAFFTYYGDSPLCRTWESGNTGPYQIPAPRFENTQQSDELRKLYKNRAPSPFSTLFSEDMADLIKQFSQAVADTDFRNNIVSIFLAAYRCGEWNIDHPAPDHSPCALKYFRNWLKLKYENTENLQTAWRDNRVDFSNALPPIDGTTLGIGTLLWLDARRNDYMEALADALSDQLISVADSVKNCAPDLQIGCFWPNATFGHQSRMDKVLEVVDYVATPLTYYNRQPGGAFASQSPVHQTPSARNRIFLDEVDTRTHIAHDLQKPYGRADNEAESIELLWRDMITPLVMGNLAWQLDFGCSGTKEGFSTSGWIPGSFNTTPKLLAEHKKINKLWRNKDKFDLSQIDEVRVFTPLYHGITNHCVDIVMSLLNMTADEWKRAGVPVAYYALEDLIEEDIPLGKLNIFSSCASLRKKDYEKLKSLLKGSNTTCLWMMGAGILEPGSGRSPSIEKLNDLTGIKQEIIYEKDVHLGTFVKNEANEFIIPSINTSFGQLERPVVANFGDFSRQAPKKPETITLPFRIRVRDNKALALGQFSNSNEICWAMKKVNGFTSIVYNLPVLPARILRKVANHAGAHIYLDEDDGLWTTPDLLIHHACSAGIKKIKFPDSQDRFDLRTNQQVGKNTDELIIDVSIGQTSVIGSAISLKNKEVIL